MSLYEKTILAFRTLSVSELRALQPELSAEIVTASLDRDRCEPVRYAGQREEYPATVAVPVGAVRAELTRAVAEGFEERAG